MNIKIRIWDKKNKKMFYSKKRYTKNGVCFDIEGELEDTNPTLMLFSNFIDDDGNKIYEGDIVRVFLDDPNKKYDIDICSEVILNSEGFGINFHGFVPLKDLYCYNLLVVGNIYEGRFSTNNCYEKKKHGIRYILRRIRRMVTK